MTSRTNSTILVSGLAVAGLMLGFGEPGPAYASLVGHWTFDGHFDDALGGYHATVPAPASGGANNVYAATDNGKIGGAAVFDGDNDALVIAKDVLPTGASAFTVAFWEFSPTVVNNFSDGYFVSAGTGTHANSDVFMRRLSSTRYAGGLVGGTFADWGSFARGTWHFNVVTKADNGDAAWYVNGNLERTQTSTFNGLTQDLWVGNSRVWTRPFEGLIDDLGIWNEALPVERIRAIGNVANSAALNYNLGQAQQLFDIHDAGAGAKGTVGTLPWRHVSDLNTAADPGTLLKIDGRDHLILGGDPGSRSGVASIGLVGHWTFDGHFEDSVGGYHATKPSTGGNDVFPGTDNGKIGGAAYFDGDKDALVISKDVLPAGTKEFTMAFWELSPTGSSNTGYFVGAGSDAAGLNDLFLRRGGSATQYDGRVQGGDSLGPFSISRGLWHFNVLTVDTDANEANWYVDGVLKGTIGTTFNGLTDNLWLGDRKGGNRDFHGWIDDLGIWNEALPVERIHAVENLARWESLNYNLGEAQQLFDIFDAGPGAGGIVGGEPWRYVSRLDITDEPGTVLTMGGWDYLILGGPEGSRMGLRMIPEPGSAGLLLCAAMTLLLFVRKRR